MKKIKEIEFGFLSPKFIKEMAAIKIEHAELYDPDGYPIDGGLTDLHLGVVAPGLKCRTCGGTIGQCLGHFGYLELTKPVIHPLYGKKIYMMLKATCGSCGRPLAADDDVKKMGNPLVELYKKKPKTCPHCSAKQKDITYQKPTIFTEEKRELNPEEIRQRLEKISDDDVKQLKIKGGRPEWFILTILPVPPVTVRPSITLETGERSEDDLTHKLVDVVRINERLRKNLEIGAPDFIIADIWELLQYHISTFMNNEISTLPPARHRSGRALKTLVQRLGKKEGRFRGNLSGKRVNFSARTVISPDTKIALDEVGVPLEIAKELSIPMKVNKNNIKDLKELVVNFPKYPTANYIFRTDNVRKKITEENKQNIADELDIGYVVERQLIDGDIVVINRQPSLHRMSMMAHRARIMPFKTIRISATVTIPYNADFDGDEMNLHVPQTEEAQAEAEMLMAVTKHIRSPRYGSPIISCKHDQITGCYLLTREGSRFSRKEAAELLAACGLELDEIKDSYTGRELFSALLPSDLNVTFRTATSYEDFVVIKNGRLTKGVIDDNALGEKKGKLIDILEKKYGGEETKRFLDRVSRLSLHVISTKGFSISISDTDVTDRTRRHIDEIVASCREEVQRIVRAKESLTQSEENRILQLAANASNEASNAVKKDLPLNAAVIMAKTGARGSFVNLNQMCAFVGQESLEGERIHRGYRNRTLPHFQVGDYGLKARGFVEHGYKRGLDPFEFFFDAINSRENLMDKSLHTRHSGYMERRLVNALQDLHVSYDGTVCDSQKRIIQFIAGEDSIDPAKSDNGRIDMERILE